MVIEVREPGRSFYVDLLQIKESLTLPMDALYSCFMLLGWCGASTISDPFRGFLECPLKE